MQIFSIWLESRYHLCILGFIYNLFFIVWNITTVVGITYRGNMRECIIHVRLIVTDIRIGN